MSTHYLDVSYKSIDGIHEENINAYPVAIGETGPGQRILTAATGQIDRVKQTAKPVVNRDIARNSVINCVAIR